jgi:two-component sensor histidine kinase
MSLISGSGKGFTLEHAIFNVFVVILIAFAVLATVINFIIDMHFVVNMLSVVGTLSMLALFYHTRIRGVFRPWHVLFLLFYSTTLLGTVYFFNAGIDGPISFMFVMMMIILVIVSPERLQAFIFLYVLAVLIGIHVYELRFPEITVPYTSREGRYVDVISSFTYCMTFMALTIIAFKRSYNRERRNVESKNNELSTLYSDLLRKNEQIKVLLKELNHRVKNNLQVVSDLLSLQARRTNDAVSIAALSEGKDRLMSMVLLHKKLYLDDSSDEVNLKEYLSDLLRYLLGDLTDGENGVRINTDIHNLSITSEVAVPFGLIMNEIVTNIRKHAFNDGVHDRQINLVCHQDGGSLLLEVRDNGIGFLKQQTDSDKAGRGFGLELIDMLVAQLEGTWSIDGMTGTRIHLQFPVAEKK